MDKEAPAERQIGHNRRAEPEEAVVWERWTKKRTFVRALEGTYGELKAELYSQPRIYKTSNLKWKGGPQNFGKKVINPQACRVAQSIETKVPESPSIEAKINKFDFTSRVDFSNPIITMSFERAFFPELVRNFTLEFEGGIKPELSNYYDRIDTTTEDSDTAYRPDFGGTSGATPITCGNAGLLFQMWADGVFDGAPGKARDVFASRPHAATAKALLINTANQHTFSGTAHDQTRTHQGWGTASVRNLYDRAKAGGWKLPVLVNETDLVTTGQTRKYTVTSNGQTPLRATLAYTDPAGSPTATKATVNDLTLKVTAPDGTVYWGNNGLLAGNWSTPGGAANTVDTVENVLVQAPAAGTWTVEVVATAVNVDGHTETAATDADYALVVS